MSQAESSELKVREEVIDLLGWPTDTVSIDHNSAAVHCHTTIVFIPGNPGCCAWYIPLISSLVSKLGTGFRARLVSYAGHAPYHPEDMDVEGQRSVKDASLSWTIDGQIRHKEAFLDRLILDSSVTSNLVFVSHSIGSHMVERLLVQRHDVLRRTTCVIHLMPFIRMKAPSTRDQRTLDFGGANPNLVISVAKSMLRMVGRLPLSTVNHLLHSVYQDDKGRDLTAHLIRQPTFARNFFELGSEEIRDVPRDLDRAALHHISTQCPISMVYCNNDHWAPYEHVPEIQSLQSYLIHPITIHHLPSHKHDFVSKDALVPPVMECCYQAIQQALKYPPNLIRSRL
eukprot:scaffold918_cov126-Cylindrotheca_fusiformis.AAC.37